MLLFFVLLNLILCSLVTSKHARNAHDLGAGLITSLRNDANLDLPADAEYEDLRAELLAYHTALASISSSRRSMKTTPCWKLGGICVNYKMCTGHKYLTEVPGCKNHLDVCCFTWNKFQVRDFRDKGIDVAAMPWKGHKEFGGKGVVDLNDPHDEKDHNEPKKHANQDNEEYFEDKPNKDLSEPYDPHDKEHGSKHKIKYPDINYLYNFEPNEYLSEINHHNKSHHQKPHHAQEESHHEQPDHENHEQSDNEQSHHQKSHVEQPDHEIPNYEQSDYEQSHHEKSHHEQPDHEKPNHEQSDHEQSHYRKSPLERSLDEKVPIVVILQTDEK